jgi:hypothetical protein
MRSRPIHQLLHLRRNPIRPVVLPSHPISVRPSLAPNWTSSSTHPSPFLSSTASFHTSPRHQNERSNLPPQSPFKVFVQTLKEEIQKNRELQEDVKKLQGDVDKFADSEAMKKAREAYERSRVSLGVATSCSGISTYPLTLTCLLSTSTLTSTLLQRPDRRLDQGKPQTPSGR